MIGAAGDGSPAVPDAASSVTAELLDALGVPLGPELLERALTHRSFAYENGGLPTNERLEFLGDSVLGLIVTDTLFREYPDLPEGQLAKLRAAGGCTSAIMSASARARRAPAAGTSRRSWLTLLRRCSVPSTWTAGSSRPTGWCTACSTR